MDIFENFNIISYDNGDNIIDQFKFKVDPSEINNLNNIKCYTLKNIFPSPFENICITNCISCEQCNPYFNDRYIQINKYISINNKIYLKSKINEINIFSETHSLNIFLNIACFMLNEIGKNNIQYPKSNINRLSIDNQNINIIKFIFKTNTDELILSCFDSFLNIYSENKFNIIYKQDNKNILNTLIYRSLYNQLIPKNNIVTTIYYYQTLGTSIIRLYNIITCNLQITDSVSYVKYIDSKLKYKIKLKQKDNEITQLNETIKQLQYTILNKEKEIIKLKGSNITSLQQLFEVTESANKIKLLEQKYNNDL